MKLVLGAAGRKEKGAVTLDINPAHNPDVTHDLNKTPWPFSDNQFDKIVCHHVLEHLDSLADAMRELHRVCSNSGEIYIEAPHHTSWAANTPEHKLRFNYFALEGYIEGGKLDWMAGGVKFRLIERRITFHRNFRRYFLHRLFNKYPLTYERFWAYIIPAENVMFRLKPVK